MEYFLNLLEYHLNLMMAWERKLEILTKIEVYEDNMTSFIIDY